MAMNSPTPIEAAIPTTPAPTTSASTLPTAPPTGQEPALAPSVPQPMPTPQPKSLGDILQERNGMGAPQVKPAEPTPVQDPNATGTEPNPEDVQKPQPVEAPVEKTNAEQAAQLWALAQDDPNKLIKLLQAVAPNNEPEKKTEYEPFNAQTYAQEAHRQAVEIFNQRPSITLSGLLGGAENLQELGLADADFSETLGQFIVSQMAPQMAALLELMGVEREKFERLQTGIQPVMATSQEQQLSNKMAPALVEAFPELKGDPAALIHYQDTFNKLAPTLIDKTLLDNPLSNPDEYVRMNKVIAMLAARDFVKASPGQTTEMQQAPQPPAPALSPAPQQVVPTYRNHLGQYQNNQEPRPATLEEANRLSAQRLMETRV